MPICQKRGPGLGTRSQPGTTTGAPRRAYSVVVSLAIRDETSSQGGATASQTSPAGLMEDFLRRLSSAESVAAAAQAAVDTVRRDLGVDISWSGVISDGVLTMAAHSGLRTSTMATAWRLSLGQGIGGRVAVEGRALGVRDYRHDPRRAPVMKRLIDEEGIRGALCAPFVDGADVLGVLYAADRSAHDWTPEEFGRVTEVARDTGSAIRRIQRHDAAFRRSAEDRQLATAARQSLLVSTEVALTTIRTDDLNAGLAVLAHHLGLHVEVVGAAGEQILGQAGAGAGERVCFEVDLGGELMGQLRVRGARELVASECELAEATGAIVVLHLLRERAALRSELRVYSEFLDDLLEGRTADRHALLARGALLGVDLRIPHHVVRVGIHPTGDSSRAPLVDREMLHRVERLTRNRYAKSIVVPRNGDIVILLPPGTDGVREVARSLEEIVRLSPGSAGRLSAGIGRLCPGVDDYIDSYAEASLALDLARRGAAANAVRTPRDLGLYGLLVRGSTRRTMESMVERALGPVLAADAGGGPELVKTLHIYLTNDRHLERAAAVLHVHPNTVRYRLMRAQQLLEVNLRDPDDRFLLELALRVRSVLEQG